MKIEMDNLLDSIMESLSRIDYIKPETLPNIDLYMDQVTTFMDKQLAASRRYEEDKILTKTMINNYAKNRLLPPPNKKKYSKNHILLLIFIYYFKNILSINDIKDLLTPLTNTYFKEEDGFSLESIYEEVFSLEKEQVEKLKQDVLDKYDTSKTTFRDVNSDDQQFLQLYSFICMLSFDVYVKKQLIEKLIDELPKQK